MSIVQRETTVEAVLPVIGVLMVANPMAAIVSKSLALCAVVFAFCSGCGIPPPTAEETNKRNEKVEKAARERQDAGIRRAENEIWMETMKNSRSIRVLSYCASSPETLVSLYDLLKNQDSERASAFADGGYRCKITESHKRRGGFHGFQSGARTGTASVRPSTI
jgi:hypothetical protein